MRKTLAQLARAAVRARASLPSNIPVEIVAGDAAPVLAGHPAHYTTRTGIPIRHPSAYSRYGWSSMCRHSSTRRIVVGADWRPVSA